MFPSVKGNGADFTSLSFLFRLPSTAVLAVISSSAVGRYVSECRKSGLPPYHGQSSPKSVPLSAETNSYVTHQWLVRPQSIAIATPIAGDRFENEEKGKRERERED